MFYIGKRGKNGILREKTCESYTGVVWWFFFILDGSFFLEATMYTEGFLLSNTIALFTQPLGFDFGVVIIRVVVVLTAVFRL